MRVKGSYTVEASLLMTVIIPLLTAIIYMGFYLHNDAVLQNAAYETAVYASLYRKEDGRDKMLEEKKQQAIEGRLLGMKKVKAEIRAGDRQVTVNYQGDFEVPGLVMRFFCDNHLAIRAESKMQLTDPVKTICKMRILEKIGKGVKE